MSYQNRPRAFNNTTNMLKVHSEIAFLIIVLNSGSAKLLGNRAITIIHTYILCQMNVQQKVKNIQIIYLMTRKYLECSRSRIFYKICFKFEFYIFGLTSSAEAGRLTQQKPEMRFTTYQNVEAASNSYLFCGP